MIKYLTWKDIKKITLIAEQMVEEDVNGILPDSAKQSEEGYYTEILERFKNLQ